MNVETQDWRQQTDLGEGASPRHEYHVIGFDKSGSQLPFFYGGGHGTAPSDAREHANYLADKISSETDHVCSVERLFIRTTASQAEQASARRVAHTSKKSNIRRKLVLDGKAARSSVSGLAS